MHPDSLENVFYFHTNVQKPLYLYTQIEKGYCMSAASSKFSCDTKYTGNWNHFGNLSKHFPSPCMVKKNQHSNTQALSQPRASSSSGKGFCFVSSLTPGSTIQPVEYNSSS